jgi:hypothetical protein
VAQFSARRGRKLRLAPRYRPVFPCGPPQHGQFSAGATGSLVPSLPKLAGLALKGAILRWRSGAQASKDRRRASARHARTRAQQRVAVAEEMAADKEHVGWQEHAVESMVAHPPLLCVDDGACAPATK